MGLQRRFWPMGQLASNERRCCVLEHQLVGLHL
jgi:hypothetical protein